MTSTDSTTALELISKEMPDVILIDIMMPHVSGLEILQQVRDDERLSHIPIIVLTASDNEQTKMEALKLGAAEFLEQARERFRTDRPRAQRLAHQSAARSPEKLRAGFGTPGSAADGGIGRLAAGIDPLPGQGGGIPRQRDRASRRPRGPLRRNHRPAIGPR